jgi:hypothetical protein
MENALVIFPETLVFSPTFDGQSVIGYHDPSPVPATSCRLSADASDSSQPRIGPASGNIDGASGGRAPADRKPGPGLKSFRENVI